jgi:hypothetical protein
VLAFSQKPVHHPENCSSRMVPQAGDVLIRGSVTTGFEVLDAVSLQRLIAFGTFEENASATLKNSWRVISPLAYRELARSMICSACSSGIWPLISGSCS